MHTMATYIQKSPAASNAKPNNGYCAEAASEDTKVCQLQLHFIHVTEEGQAGKA